MKTFMMISFLMVCAGCMNFASDVYGTSCVNVGSRTIFVPEFELYRSDKFSKVVCGELRPGSRVGSSPYSQKPSEKVVVSWKVLDSGEEESKTVDVILPTHRQWGRFTSTIIFYIDPDRKQVQVCYDMFDAVTGVRETIDSSGRSVDLETGEVKGK